MKKTDLESILAARLREANLLQLFERQVTFRSGFMLRKWRFDFYSHAHKLAIEVEGGTFAGGRHSRGVGMSEDMEKYNSAVLAGIRVLRFDSTMIIRSPTHKRPPRTKKAARRRALEGTAINVIRAALYTEFIKKPRR